MTTTLKIAAQELRTYLTKPSWLILTLAIPLVLIGASFFLNRSSPTAESVGATLGEIGDAEAADLPATGRLALVDLSGVVGRIPDFLAETVIPYPDVAAAEAELRAGRVDAYYVVAADYMASGAVERVARRFSPLAEDSAVIRFLLGASLLEGVPPTVQALIREPIVEGQLEVENIGTRAADTAVGGEDAGGLAYGLGYGLAMLIYITAFTSAGYLLAGLATERENRVMEILLTTVTPLQLLAGKIIGQGALGLIQVGLWALGALVAARRMPSLPLESLGITPALVALLILYFVLAYLVYGAQMLALGALVPSVRENGPATFAVVMPAIVPLFLLGSLVEQPHSPVAVALSLFPLTSPVTMAIRLAQGGVPGWQIALSIAILMLTIPLILAGVARLFRAQILLGSAIPSRAQIVAALRGQAAS